MIQRCWALLFYLFWASTGSAQPSQPLRDEALPYIIAELTDGTVNRGSGVVIDASGRMLTALHVVHGAKSVTAKWAGRGEVALAKVAGIVPDADLAVLRLPTRSTPYAFYPMVSPQWQGHVRDRVEVAGHPLSFRRQLLPGTLPQDGFARSNTIMTADRHTLLRVDKVDLLLVVVTAPNGLSGAPVLTATGEVAAILSGSYAQSTGYAFASPTKHLASPTYVSLERSPQDIRPWPAYVFADLGGLRTLSQSIAPQNSCTTAIESFKSVAKSARAIALVASANLSIAQPTLERVRAGTVGDDASRWRQLEVVWDAIRSPAQQAVESLQARDRAWATMAVECDPRPKFKANLDALGTIPVNGRNVAAVQIQAAQIEALSQKLNQRRQETDNILAGINRALASNAALTDQSPPSARAKATLEMFDQARDLMSYVTNRLDADSQDSLDVMLYASDFGDRIAAYPWDRRSADPQFTALGMFVRPVPGWIRVTEEVVRAGLTPQQLPQAMEALRRWVVLRHITTLQHANGVAAALVWRYTAPHSAEANEAVMRQAVEKAMRDEAAATGRTLAGITTSARLTANGWLSEGLETPARPGMSRKQLLIRYAAPEFIYMNCTLFSETTSPDLCRKQFDQIMIAR